ncbi:MAG: holo-ACP synthase [Desulfosporosinus fructosivorans]
MILGIGTDILKIKRVRDVYDSNNDAFFKKTYTAKERDQAEERPDPMLYYATRFAGKEAVFKALGEAGNWLRPAEIEILNQANGQPTVTLLGELHQLSEKRKLGIILLSLSYDTDYAIACAIIQSFD